MREMGRVALLTKTECQERAAEIWGWRMMSAGQLWVEPRFLPWVMPMVT